MSWLEAETSRTFGRGPRPLLVSVRSGATQSMPGMMDTILNLGMNDAVERALAASGAAEFARDTRRRFTTMYQRIVGAGDQHSVPTDPYAQLRARHRGGVRLVEFASRGCLPRPLRPRRSGAVPL